MGTKHPLCLPTPAPPDFAWVNPLYNTLLQATLDLPKLDWMYLQWLSASILAS